MEIVPHLLQRLRNWCHKPTPHHKWLTNWYYWTPGPSRCWWTLIILLPSQQYQLILISIMPVAIKYIGRTSGERGIRVITHKTDNRKSSETALKYHLYQHLFIMMIIYAMQRVDGSGYRSLENLKMSFYLASESLLKFYSLWFDSRQQ